MAAVQAAGHHVVLSSGRSLIAMAPVAERARIEDGWIVASNGAVTVRLDLAAPMGCTLDRVVTFDPEPVLRMLKSSCPTRATRWRTSASASG